MQNNLKAVQFLGYTEILKHNCSCVLPAFFFLGESKEEPCVELQLIKMIIDYV